MDWPSTCCVRSHSGQNQVDPPRLHMQYRGLRCMHVRSVDAEEGGGEGGAEVVSFHMN